MKTTTTTRRRGRRRRRRRRVGVSRSAQAKFEVRKRVLEAFWTLIRGNGGKGF
jgi:hypothetical protein